jgi:hypothetical protein
MIESLSGASAPQGAKRPQRGLPRRQLATAVLMVRPAAFDYNPETALTNTMQKRPPAAGSAQSQACAELDQLALALTAAGVAVCVVQDTPAPPKPDAVFPNNWVSFHEDGTLVLYPMQPVSRRPERRQAVIDQVVERLGLRISRVVDLTPHESAGRFLEGTGSLVLDHVQRIAYACLSPRTHPEVIAEWSQALGYEPVVFKASDRAGVPLYHTNVLLTIGRGFAVVGSAAIAPADREGVLDRLRASGRELIQIGHAGIERFAGNMLELSGEQSVLALSATARDAFGPEVLARLAACTGRLLAVPVPTIERLGGGSVRCMLAEVFLKPQ